MKIISDLWAALTRLKDAANNFAVTLEAGNEAAMTALQGRDPMAGLRGRETQREALTEERQTPALEATPVRETDEEPAEAERARKEAEIEKEVEERKSKGSRSKPAMKR